MKARNYKTRNPISNNFVLFPGITIILVSLIHMIVNLDQTDYFVNSWIIFVMLGIGLTACGIIIDLKKIRKIK